jgi:hypothetical protein
VFDRRHAGHDRQLVGAQVVETVAHSEVRGHERLVAVAKQQSQRFVGIRGEFQRIVFSGWIMVCCMQNSP